MLKCPHCMIAFHDEWEIVHSFIDADGKWALRSTKCPACEKVVLQLATVSRSISGMHGNTMIGETLSDFCLLRPLGSNRPPCPLQVIPSAAEDYAEACLVLPFSAKASAALSRRCLQEILTDQGFLGKSLALQIDAFISSPEVPTFLKESIDLVRGIGNFAAHTQKSSSSGEILSVESGEAEVTLNILEGLFDFFYVQPDLMKQRIASFNNKLQNAGKPELKPGTDS